MIARFLGVRVWELSKVAVHYQDEAAVILSGLHEARVKLAKQHKVSMGTVIFPEI